MIIDYFDVEYWGGLEAPKSNPLLTDEIGHWNFPKAEQKQHIIEIMKGDEELGLYEEPKQETLEEANWKVLGTKDDTFFNGAKWQQEQIGKSEFLQRLRGTLSDAEARRLIFEQFKKK